MTKFTVDTAFEGKNLEAQRAARRHAAKRVTAVSAETKKAIRSVIVRSIADGLDPRQAARMIKSMVGLNERQAQAAMNYRSELVGLGHTPARVEALVDRYTGKLLRQRGLAIARTETMSALNKGQIANWEEARKQGLIGADAEMEWIATPDSGRGPCPVCASMDGKRVKVGAAFEAPGPPAHVHCLCTIAVML
jgi:hypothetical protein